MKKFRLIQAFIDSILIIHFVRFLAIQLRLTLRELYYEEIHDDEISDDEISGNRGGVECIEGLCVGGLSVVKNSRGYTLLLQKYFFLVQCETRTRVPLLLRPCEIRVKY